MANMARRSPRDKMPLRSDNAVSLVTLTFSAHNASSTYATEIFLLLQIGLCLGMVGILDTSRYSIRHWKISWERLVIKTIMIYDGLSFNLWFWWVGLDAMLETPCGTFLWVVVRTDMYGRARTVMRVFAIHGLVERTFNVTLREVARALHAWFARTTRADFRARLHESTGNHGVPRTHVKKVYQHLNRQQLTSWIHQGSPERSTVANPILTTVRSVKRMYVWPN